MSVAERTRIDPARLKVREPDLGFATTAELEDLEEPPGQDRALEALRFGVDIRADGYNLFVLGSVGSGRHTVVVEQLESRARTESPGHDWCYVNDFAEPTKPRVLRLDPGLGIKLRSEIEHLVDDLESAIPQAFESDEYRARTAEIQQVLQERQQKAFGELEEAAESEGISFLHTPAGFAFAPMRESEVLSSSSFKDLPKDEQQEIEDKVRSLQERLQAILQDMPSWQREAREKVRALDRETTLLAVLHLVDEVRGRWEGWEGVLAHLDALQEDVIENVDQFRRSDDNPLASLMKRDHDSSSTRRYGVNVLVDRSEAEGAAVVYADHPTFSHLVGRTEHHAQLGTLVTDFLLIRSGALHCANEGYLILDARKVLVEPFAYEGLKRALLAKRVRVESAAQLYSLTSTEGLEPEPIPLDLKVVLIGEPFLYYLLHHHDPDFGRLFKVVVDFDDRIPRSDETELDYVRFLSTQAKRRGLLPIEAKAMGRVLEQASRLDDDSEHLSTHQGRILDLLTEADHAARAAGREAVAAEDVTGALERQKHRRSRLQERILSEIDRGIIHIATDGEGVGEVNGLSVHQLGDHRFGRPARITATVRLGEGKIVDIEREVELGGATHSKGVLILSHFLASRYAREEPLSLAASLAFEQSYGPIDGDSASVGELCALLSALSGIPIRHRFAITGSVNQQGEVQAIGGVNEKIEGFFDVCRAREMTGEQGVIIPASNVVHLVLDERVREAVEAGTFHLHAVQTVDEALELLTGVPAGARDAEGVFPEGSVNRRVEDRLVELAKLRAKRAEEKADGGDEG